MNSPRWTFLHPNATYESLGYIPQFLNTDNPKSAAQQIDANYKHGGGWRPFKGHTLNLDTLALKYPGDPPLKPIASTVLRNERILFYPHSWIVIIQPDNSWEVAKVD